MPIFRFERRHCCPVFALSAFERVSNCSSVGQGERTDRTKMREPAHLLRLRHLAASLLLLNPPFLEVQAHPNPQPQVPGSGGRPGGNPAPAPVIPWVSVDPAGSGITITPSVFTSDGARTTVNNPPDSLTSTATYTLSPGGTSRPDLVSTYTGLAPVASATGVNNDAGAFIACDWRQGDDEPFCLPKRGAVLYPGRTYYGTSSCLTPSICIFLNP